MEDSRGDGKRPEQQMEDTDATREDDLATHESPATEASGGLEGPSTARQQSDEAVSKTEVLNPRSVEKSTKDYDIRSTISVLPGDDTKQEGSEAKVSNNEGRAMTNKIGTRKRKRSNENTTTETDLPQATSSTDTTLSPDTHNQLMETLRRSIHGEMQFRVPAIPDSLEECQSVVQRQRFKQHKKLKEQKFK